MLFPPWRNSSSTTFVRSRVEDGLALGPRRAAMATMLVATVMAVLDGTIANVALPTIGRELHADAAASIWVVNGFQIAVTATLLGLSSLGSLLGYTGVYRMGIGLFTLGSLLCALAPSLGYLIAARVLQGVGGAAIMAIAPALVRELYPKARLGVGIGAFALTVASSAAAGPTVGGLILAVLPWPWLFAINVPLGLVDLLASTRTLPKVAGRGDVRAFDWRGATLSGRRSARSHSVSRGSLTAKRSG